MEDPSPWARALGLAAAHLADVQPLLPTYAHLLASALFPIYAGAHASLARPASAARRKKRVRRRRGEEGGDGDSEEEDEDDEDDEEEEEHKMEGLAPADAIMMPLFAGCALAALYFLLKWLKDPHYLNLVLNWYFAVFGVFAVSRLVTDALDIGHSIIYPRRFARGGALYHVEQRQAVAVPVAGEIKGKAPLASPLPGFLSYVPVSEGVRKLLWSDRGMPGNKWTLRVYVHKMFSGKVLLGPHGMVGAAVSVGVWAYFNFVDKPWYLTNLIGFGFSYAALQLMSPTTFATGSLILGALFFYDIYFVFFTPMMVTVAQSIDAPIKLVFPRPESPSASKSQYAMLGLGDVVLPGIMIGLALRFDLFVFYLRRQTRLPSPDSTAPPTVTKATYHSLAGRWTDHFWSHSLFGRPLWRVASGSETAEPPFTFPKTYFRASLVGYVLGMLTTLGVMHVWGHAQPALLYLVPGVLGSLWLTALVRGELGLMWNFSEESEEEDGGSEAQVQGGQEKEKDKAKAKENGGRESIFSLSDKKAAEREGRVKSVVDRHVVSDEGVVGHGSKKARGGRADREVFAFSIEAPWKVKVKGKGKGKGKKGEEDEEDEEVKAVTTRVDNEVGGGERAGKKARLS